MNLIELGSIAGSATALVGTGALVIRYVGSPLRRLAQQNDEFREDWYGLPARPGRSAVPGVPERLARIEQELRPNGGSTLRDAVNRLEQRFDDHLRTHQQQPPSQP